MLSRADRILADFLLSRHLAPQAAIAEGARRCAEDPDCRLVDVLVDTGALDSGVGREAAAEVAEIEAALQPEVNPGRRLGDFRLLGELGRGAMGIVFEAEQTSLERRVAVKILPAGAALDDLLAARFLREARAAGRLRHPGIVPVFASGRVEGVLYFAMEKVSGRSLGELLARTGTLPARRAAQIARGVALALDHAHRHGVVHRDVKPENILIDESGEVRLTDFGLALDAESSTRSVSRHVLGTPAYMSREQARGEEVDGRSDIYSLGAVLFHMLTGKPPFEDEIGSVILSRLIKERPPSVQELRPDLPGDLAEICNRALSPDPDLRQPTAGAMADALQRFLDREPVAAGVPTAGSGAPGRRDWSLLALPAALLLGWGVMTLALAPTGGVGTPATSLEQATSRGESPEAAGLGLSVIPGPAPGAWPGLSPDGGRLAFSRRVEGRWLVHVADLEGAGPARPLAPEIEGDQKWPKFSPDGDLVVLSARDGLKLVDSRTGALVRDLGEPVGGCTWSPDGRMLAVAVTREGRRRLWLVPADGGPRSLLTSMDSAEPVWSPHGHRIALVSRSTDGEERVLTIPAQGGGATRVTGGTGREWSPAWSPDGGTLYFGALEGDHPDVWAVEIDEVTGHRLGPPRQVSHGLMAASFLLVSSPGSERMALAPQGGTDGVVCLPLAPDGTPRGGPRLLSGGVARVMEPAPSPAGVSFVSTESVEESLVIRTLGSSAQDSRRPLARQPLTRGLSRDGGARWSPDGDWIAYHSRTGGEVGVWLARADGSEDPRLLARGASYPVWSPAGDELAVSLSGGGAGLIDLSGSGPVRRLPEMPGAGDRFEPWSWSRDGRWLAGTCDGVVILDLDSGSYRRLSRDGRRPWWTADGRHLVLWRDEGLWRISESGGEPRPVFSYATGGVRADPTLSRDGHWVFFSTEVQDGGLWLLEPEEEPTRR